MNRQASGLVYGLPAGRLTPEPANADETPHATGAMPGSVLKNVLFAAGARPATIPRESSRVAGPVPTPGAFSCGRLARTPVRGQFCRKVISGQ